MSYIIRYGDNYDITGGAVAPNGDVSLASKHRFKWVEDAQVAMVTPATLPQGTTKRYTIRPFDRRDVVLAGGEVLGVRLDTRFMGAHCPKGEFDWCTRDPYILTRSAPFVAMQCNGG